MLILFIKLFIIVKICFNVSKEINKINNIKKLLHDGTWILALKFFNLRLYKYFYGVFPFYAAFIFFAYLLA